MSDEKKTKGGDTGLRTFRIKDGVKFYDANAERDSEGRPVRVPPGSTVQLTPAQAKAFADLVEAV